MSTVTYNDFGKDITFEIKPLRAFKAWSFTNLLLGILAKTDVINPESLRKIIALKFGSQEHLSTEEKEEINRLFQMDLLDTLFNVIKSAISGMNSYQEKEIMSIILSCVFEVNGSMKIPMELNSKDPNCNIEDKLQNPINYYKLVYEVLKETYSGLF